MKFNNVKLREEIISILVETMDEDIEQIKLAASMIEIETIIMIDQYAKQLLNK